MSTLKEREQKTPGGRETPVVIPDGGRAKDEVMADFRKIATPKRDRDQGRKAKP